MADIGTLTASLELDTRGVARDVQRFERSLRGASDRLTGVDRAGRRTKTTVDQLQAGVRRTNSELNRASSSANRSAAAMNRARDSAGRFAAQSDRAAASSGRFSRALARVRVGALEARTGIFDATTAMRGFIALGVAAAATRIAGSFVAAGSQVEGFRVRLQAMSGSAEVANQQMATFRDIAATTPFTLPDVIQAAVQLEAFGANAELTTKAVADLAAFMGVSIPEAAAAFGRAFSAGAGAADVLRERGVLNEVRRLQLLKGELGELTDLTLPKFREALLNALVDPSGRIQGTTNLLARTWVGAVSQMSDAWFDFRAAIAESGFLQFITRLIEGATRSMRQFSAEFGIGFEVSTASANQLEARLAVLQRRIEGIRAGSGIGRFIAERIAGTEGELASEIAQIEARLEELSKKSGDSGDALRDMFNSGVTGADALKNKIKDVGDELDQLLKSAAGNEGAARLGLETLRFQGREGEQRAELAGQAPGLLAAQGQAGAVEEFEAIANTLVTKSEEAARKAEDLKATWSDINSTVLDTGRAIGDDLVNGTLTWQSALKSVLDMLIRIVEQLARAHESQGGTGGILGILTQGFGGPAVGGGAGFPTAPSIGGTVGPSGALVGQQVANPLLDFGPPATFADGAARVKGPMIAEVGHGPMGELIAPLEQLPSLMREFSNGGGNMGGQGDNINVSMTVNTPDVRGFKKSQQQIAGELTRAVMRGRRTT